MNKPALEEVLVDLLNVVAETEEGRKAQAEFSRAAAELLQHVIKSFPRIAPKLVRLAMAPPDPNPNPRHS